MELGALVCTARTPRCVDCPVLDRCAWQRAGRPAYAGPPRRGQTYAGTDRQCRGRILAVLRDAEGPVAKPALDAAWADDVQRERALDALIADGLVDPWKTASTPSPAESRQSNTGLPGLKFGADEFEKPPHPVTARLAVGDPVVGVDSAVPERRVTRPDQNLRQTGVLVVLGT